MTFDAEKWSLLDKAHDYRFLLRLLAFGLVADLILTWGGTNIWAVSWSDLGVRPGLVGMVVLAYGLTMTLGAAVISHLAMDVLNLVVPPVQSRLGLSPEWSPPNPLRFVPWSEAEAWLVEQPDASRRQPVEQKMAERQADRRRWHSVVRSSWACMTLLGLSLTQPDTSVALLEQWNAWAPWLLFLAPACPCAYQAWIGPPGHDYVELPERAEQLYRQRFPEGRARARMHAWLDVKSSGPTVVISREQ